MSVPVRHAAVALAGILALTVAPAAAASPEPHGPAATPAVARAALLPTTITGFSARTVTVNQGSTFAVTAKVSGPGRRVVVVQRLSGKRWVNVVTSKTSARGALSLKVKASVVGTNRFRLVVARVGLFAAKVSAVKIVIVKKVQLKYVPGVISGTFTGTQYQGAKGPASKPFLTWNGSAEFADVKRYGNSYSYRLTRLAVTWSIDTTEGDCTFTGSGSFSLADADLAASSATYEPWGPYEPGRYSLDVVLASGQKRFPYRAVCSFGYEYDATFWSEFRTAELLRLGRTGVVAPNATVVGGWPRSLDGMTFTGAIAAQVDSAAGDNTWSFTGDLGFPFPRY